jgi:hypothetical protein
MVGIHSVGFDMPLFGAFLNPYRAASGAEGATHPAHQEDHALGLADRTMRHRHRSLPLPSLALTSRSTLRVSDVPLGGGLEGARAPRNQCPGATGWALRLVASSSA